MRDGVVGEGATMVCAVYLMRGANGSESVSLRAISGCSCSVVSAVTLQIAEHEYVHLNAVAYV
jgi:hypothetical protein